MILFANAVTFVLSALVLSRLRFGAAPRSRTSRSRGPASFARRGRASGVIAGMVGVRAVIVASGAMLLFAGLFNVAELPFAIDELDAGNAGFGALTAVYGLGFVGGSCPARGAGARPC